MYGIQGIGLRGGIASTPPSTPEYPVTGSPNVVISNISYDSANGYALVTTAQAHGFDNDDYIQISGCLPEEYNGIFQITPAQFTTTGFSIYQRLHHQLTMHHRSVLSNWHQVHFKM